MGEINFQKLDEVSGTDRYIVIDKYRNVEQRIHLIQVLTLTKLVFKTGVTKVVETQNLKLISDGSLSTPTVKGTSNVRFGVNEQVTQ